MNKSIDAIKVIIVVNVALFALPLLMPDMEEKLFGSLALYPFHNDKFKYWQLVTTMFMHGGFAHLLFNMYALWAFGTPIETIWGKRKFVLFYFVAGIGASVIYTMINYFQFNAIYSDLINAGISPDDINHLLRTGQFNKEIFNAFSEDKLSTIYNLYRIPAVGASGAIYGVLVAFGIMFPNAKLALIFLPVPIAAKYFIPILIALDLFSGLTGFSIFGGGIAHFAHIGGAVIGFLLMLYWNKGLKSFNGVEEI